MTAPRAREHCRPAGLARLAGARRGFFRSGRALAAVACLALVGAFALPAPAQAATLVSNLGQLTSTYALGSDYAPEVQGFRTGTHPAGYSLTSAQLYIDSFVDSATIADLTISLRARATGDLDWPASTNLVTFVNPIFTNAGTLTFTLPTGTTIDLTPSTVYFVVIDINTGSSVNIGNTTATDEDSGKATGWEILNVSLYTSGAWDDNTYMYRIAVNGTPKNTPATGLPTITGMAAVGDVLTAVTTGIADVDGLPSSYSYQWIQVNDMAGETDISGATSSTYTLVAADVGKHFKVKVTFEDDGGFDEELTSKLHPARTGGICARTEQVRDAIVAATAATTCANVTATHLSGLGILDLSNRSISSLQSGDFAELTGLTRLWLRNNTLSSLPANIFDGLTVLNWLRLEGNALSSLRADSFDGLTALRQLNLSGNALSILPANIFAGLTALERLTLQNNALSNLPSGLFAGLTALRTLTLSYNARNLPSGLFAGLTALADLVLANNDTLTGLPAGLFTGLTALDDLNLSYNALSSLPAGIFAGLTALDTLRLNHNALTSLPPGIFDRLTVLEVLSLCSTPLTELELPAVLYDRLIAHGVSCLPDNVRVRRGASASSVPTTPGVPQNLSGVPGDGQVTLTWDAPSSDGGSAITRYEYEVDDSGTWLDADLDLEETVTGLTNGQEYAFAVRAVNAAGPGPATSETATPATPPGAPQNLRSRPGNEQVTLTWDAPSSDGGSAITGYQYEIDDSGTWLDAGLDRRVTVIGLDNGRQYTVAVRAVNAAGSGDEATAVVTLVNSDPLLRAWLSRFGRTVATHVTDTVGERMRDTAAPSSHVTVGGYRLPLGTRGADPAEPGMDTRSPGKKKRPETTEAEALRLSMGTASGSAVGLKGTRPGPGDVGLDPWADRPGQDSRLGQTQTLRLRDLFMGSSFRLMLGGDDARPGAMRLTAWGRVAGTQFNGRDRDVALDGDVITGTLGVDREWERWLAGVAVSHSRGDGSYTIAGSGGDGELENALTSIHPYLRYAVNERLDVWGVLGYGWGDVTLKPGPGVSLETGTTLMMGSFGGRGIILPATELGGFELATRTDAMLTRMTSDADAVLDATEADAHRLRLVLEGTREVTWPEGQSVTPAVEIGLRHDWGDAETGFGLELGGRVQYADPGRGLTIEAAVRGLLAHEDSDYGEWGASGSLRIAPGPDGQGLALTLAPAWGAASSGVEGLWSRQTTAGLAQTTQQRPTARLNAEVGYGLATFGTGLLTPYAGAVLSDGQTQSYRLGTRWTSLSGLALTLEGTCQEPGQQPPTQTYQLQATWSF